MMPRADGKRRHTASTQTGTPIDTFLAERTATSHANGLPVPDSALPHVLRCAKALT
ncbi:TPA: hypothetical protein QDC59_003171 [Burkholderia cenocepacia]|nr:hypothetical protein [Burkholderia cenocepacia]